MGVGKVLQVLGGSVDLPGKLGRNDPCPCGWRAAERFLRRLVEIARDREIALGPEEPNPCRPSAASLPARPE